MRKAQAPRSNRRHLTPMVVRIPMQDPIPEAHVLPLLRLESHAALLMKEHPARVDEIADRLSALFEMLATEFASRSAVPLRLVRGAQVEVTR